MSDARQTPLDSLIAQVAQGDRRAFDALYEASSARLNALCLSILKDRREAEEVLEQVYIGIWKDAAHVKDSGLSPMAWMVTRARNRAMERRRTLGLPDSGPGPGGDADAVTLLGTAYLEGLDCRQLASRHGLSSDEARHALHEGLERLSGHAPDEGESLAAAEQALGLRTGPAPDPARLAEWQERLARFADGLTPVMAPARARQRIREHLGHGVAPLSVDPLERTPWWHGPLGIIAIVLILALAWYFWMGRG